MTDAIEWPRELWMAEREERDQGVISGVLSEHATVARWAGDKERDREFHRYVDADIHDSADRYYRTQIATLRAQLATARADVLRAAASEVIAAADGILSEEREAASWGGPDPRGPNVSRIRSEQAKDLRTLANRILALIDKETDA